MFDLNWQLKQQNWFECCGVVVIFTAQLLSTKSEIRFSTGSNPACGMLEIRVGEDL